jgi:hypothetical protein
MVEDDLIRCPSDGLPCGVHGVLNEQEDQPVSRSKEEMMKTADSIGLGRTWLLPTAAEIRVDPRRTEVEQIAVRRVSRS